MTEQIDFALKHGRNTTGRMVSGILEAIMKRLSEGIELDGRHLKVKQLGSILTDANGETRLLFDVKNPDDTFDHIEFKILKTGWGRSL